VVKSCPVACEFTRDQSRAATADAVVMELINHPKFGLREDEPIAWPAPLRANPRAAADAGPQPTAIPPRLPLTVLFYFEAGQSYPRYSMGDADVMAHVDVTMTPSTKSMLPLTMACPWGRTPGHFTHPPPAKTPGRLLAYFNEHGIASGYAPAVDELFAAAGDRLDAFIHRRNKPMPDEAGGSPFQLSNRLDFLGTYKFVLVTEAIEEDDWIEPDLSQVFLAGAVPVSCRVRDARLQARRRPRFFHLVLLPSPPVSTRSTSARPTSSRTSPARAPLCTCATFRRAPRCGRTWPALTTTARPAARDTSPSSFRGRRAPRRRS
jgi:hypothetical protein